MFSFYVADKAGNANKILCNPDGPVNNPCVNNNGPKMEPIFIRVVR